MKVIGIDIGTTTISMVVYEPSKNEVLTSLTREHKSFLKGAHSWERLQDVSVIERTAGKMLTGLLAEYETGEEGTEKAGTCEIAAIGLSGQMHGILYVDADGNAVSPLYTWQDQSGEAVSAGEAAGAEKVPDGAARKVTDWIREQCGREECTGFGLVTHLALMQQKRVPSNAASFCTIADYFGMRLTGRKTPLLHTSMAAGTGFFDVEKGCFLENELYRLGVDCSLLPQVTDRITKIGTYCKIPVFTAIGDNQASFLGSIGSCRENSYQEVVCQEGDCSGQDTLLINMGTGGQISMVSDRYYRIPGIDTRPFLHGKYLLAGASLCGGKAYAMLEHFFRTYAAAAGAEEKPQYEVMQQLAEQAMKMKAEKDKKTEKDKKALKTGNRGQSGGACGGNRNLVPTVKTTFLGTRQNPEERGSITGLGEENFTPGGLILGVLYGMADELAEMYETTVCFTGRQASRIIASGNGVRLNPVLQQVLEQRFGQKIRLSECREEAACGAAISVWETVQNSGGEKLCK
ncbi:MAG: sedoheptulokinase [Lachnospiraceae bacterium]